MLRGYRYVILATFGFLILANATQDENKKGQKGQAQPAPHQQVAATPIIPPAVNAPQPKRADDRCEDEYNRSRDCQAASAQATVNQARYAYWQTSAGLIGSAIGLLTLIVAGVAAYFAERAAHHTKRSADIAAESQRPWINLSVGIEPANPYKGREDEIYFGVALNLINKGSFPATNVRVAVTSFCLKEQERGLVFGFKDDTDKVNAIFDEHLKDVSLGYPIFFDQSHQEKRHESVAVDEDILNEFGGCTIIICASVIYTSPLWQAERLAQSASAFILTIRENGGFRQPSPTKWKDKHTRAFLDLLYGVSRLT